MMGRSPRCGFMMLGLTVCGFVATPAAAQWHLDAQAGRLQYEAAPEAPATSLGVALSRFTADSRFGLSAGVPFSREEPVWAAMHGSRRVATEGAFQLGVDLGGSGFGYRIAAGDSLSILNRVRPAGEPVTGWGASAEAMPLVAWSGRSLFAEARTGAVFFVTSADGSAASDRTAFVTDAAVVSTPFPALALRLDAKWVAVSEGSFPFAGLGASWSPGVSLWGSIGKWLDPDIPTLSWTAGASVPLGSRLAVMVSGRRDALDPVYATPARTTWGAGLSLRLGSASVGVPEPVPAAYEGGVATIAIDARDVDGEPSIAGDFNDWTPAPMTRRGSVWSYDVALAPGVYSYAFVDPAGEWFVPEGTPGRRDDGMGGHIAVLIVEEP